jgi:hypothetical protein
MSVIIRKTTPPNEISGIPESSLLNCYLAQKLTESMETLIASVTVSTLSDAHLIVDLPLPDPVYDLLDAIMHQQAKKRPTADDILGKLSELERNLRNASRPHCEYCTPSIKLTYSELTSIDPFRLRQSPRSTYTSTSA